ncbi:MAG: metallophosphatase family protein [Bacteroidia bacterium]|jgi:hypothetical protein|nr:metallophosphatase family protein [Bacteroidia bacterium]
MRKILLLSDTHGYIDEAILRYAEGCDEIWHGGDIGTTEVSDALEQKKLFRAVHGNIDGQEIRIRYPKINRFVCEGMDILMIHIAGKPDTYTAEVKQILQYRPPQVLVCGHSHILMVKRSERYGCMHLNPGAAGKHGFHHVRTMLRFVIDKGRMSNMEVIELGPRAELKSTKTVG